jgi:nicotinamidase/pyrazinamidase
VARYDPETALIVVDTQNDFADPAGSLAVAGGSDVVPILNGEMQRARDGGATILFTQDWHPQVTPHFQKDGGVWPVHCVQGTWGAELHPDLIANGPVVRKGSNGEDGYSGFTQRDPLSGETVPTELDGLLREAGVQRVVIGGLATDYCVLQTVLDARRLGYETTVLTEAIRPVEVTPGDGERAIQAMAAAGATLDPG